MKKTFILIFAGAICFASCNNAGKNGNSSAADSTSAGSDTTNARALFSQAVGKTVSAAKVPRYELVKTNTRGLDSNAAVQQLKTTNNSGCNPTKITDLNSGSEYNIYKFDQSMSASAQAMGFTGSISRNELVFIEDYVRYQICPKDNKRYGVGLRCYIHVTSVHGKLSYSSLPAIAANVELNNAKATFNIKSLGFAFDGSLLQGTPVTGDYNVDDFGKLAVIFTNVAKLLTNDSKTTFSPVELPVPEQ